MCLRLALRRYVLQRNALAPRCGCNAWQACNWKIADLLKEAAANEVLQPLVVQQQTCFIILLPLGSPSAAIKQPRCPGATLAHLTTISLHRCCARRHRSTKTRFILRVTRWCRRRTCPRPGCPLLRGAINSSTLVRGSGLQGCICSVASFHRLITLPIFGLIPFIGKSGDLNAARALVESGARSASLHLCFSVSFLRFISLAGTNINTPTARKQETPLIKAAQCVGTELFCP
jgi:hypothetical protein